MMQTFAVPLSPASPAPPRPAPFSFPAIAAPLVAPLAHPPRCSRAQVTVPRASAPGSNSRPRSTASSCGDGAARQRPQLRSPPSPNQPTTVPCYSAWSLRPVSSRCAQAPRRFPCGRRACRSMPSPSHRASPRVAASRPTSAATSCGCTAPQPGPGQADAGRRQLCQLERRRGHQELAAAHRRARARRCASRTLPPPPPSPQRLPLLHTPFPLPGAGTDVPGTFCARSRACASRDDARRRHLRLRRHRGVAAEQTVDPSTNQPLSVDQLSKRTVRSMIEDYIAKGPDFLVNAGASLSAFAAR